MVGIVRDISSIVEMIEESRKSREYAESLIDSANNIIVALDIEGHIQTFNRAAEQVTGYRRDEVLGKNWFDFMMPEDQYDRSWLYLKSATQPHFNRHFENTLMTSNGELRHIEWQVNAIREQGAVTGVIGFGIDLTDKKRVETLLRRQEEYIRGIIDGIEVRFFVVDHNYRYLIFNQAHSQTMKSIFGVDIALGKNILDYHSDTRQRETAKQNLDKALLGETCIVEDFVGDEKIARQFNSIEHHPIWDSQRKVIGVAVFSRDITDLRRAEQEAKECDLRYRQLVEDIQVVIMALSLDGNIKYINEFGLKFFGYPKEEILDRPADEAIIPDKDAIGETLWRKYRSFWQHQGGLRETLEHRLQSGKHAWVDWTVREGINPLTGEHGKLCIGIDVTAKRLSQEEERRRRERQLCNELMNDIVSSRIDPQKAWDLASKQGISLQGPFVCIVLSRNLENAAANETITDVHEWDIIVDRMKDYTKGIAWSTDKKIAVLLTASNTCLRINEFYKMIKSYASINANSMGVAFQTGPDEPISVLYSHAVIALEFGAIQNPSETIHYWHKMGWLRLLAQNAHSQEAEQYVKDHLGPILQLSQSEKREVLLNTLSDIPSGESVESIAARTNVHPQTVRYRRRMLEELLGVQIGKNEAMVNLLIAYKIHQIREKASC